MLYLNGYSLSMVTDKLWLQLFLSLLSVNMIFWVIAFIVYVTPLNIVYNVWIPIAVFSALDFISNIYSDIKNVRR